MLFSIIDVCIVNGQFLLGQTKSSSCLHGIIIAFGALEMLKNWYSV